MRISVSCIFKMAAVLEEEDDFEEIDLGFTSSRDRRIVSTADSGDDEDDEEEEEDDDNLELLRQTALKSMEMKKTSPKDRVDPQKSPARHASLSSTSTEYEEIALNSPTSEDKSVELSPYPESNEEEPIEYKELTEEENISNEWEDDEEYCEEHALDNGKNADLIENLTITFANEATKRENEERGETTDNEEEESCSSMVEGEDIGAGEAEIEEEGMEFVEEEVVELEVEEVSEEDADADEGVVEWVEAEEQEDIEDEDLESEAADDKEEDEADETVEEDYEGVEEVEVDEDSIHVPSHEEECNEDFIEEAKSIQGEVSGHDMEEQKNPDAENKICIKEGSKTDITKLEPMATVTSLQTSASEKKTDTKGIKDGDKGSVLHSKASLPVINVKNETDGRNKGPNLKEKRGELHKKESKSMPATLAKSMVTENKKVNADQLSIGGSSSDSMSDYEEASPKKGVKSRVGLTRISAFKNKKSDIRVQGHGRRSQSHSRSRSRSRSRYFPGDRQQRRNNFRSWSHDRNFCRDIRDRLYPRGSRTPPRNGRSLSRRSRSPQWRGRIPPRRRSPPRRSRSPLRRSRSPLRRSRSPLRRSRSPLRRSRSPLRRSRSPLRRGKSPPKRNIISPKGRTDPIRTRRSLSKNGDKKPIGTIVDIKNSKRKGIDSHSVVKTHSKHSIQSCSRSRSKSPPKVQSSSASKKTVSNTLEPDVGNMLKTTLNDKPGKYKVESVDVPDKKKLASQNGNRTEVLEKFDARKRITAKAAPVQSKKIAINIKTKVLTTKLGMKKNTVTKQESEEGDLRQVLTRRTVEDEAVASKEFRERELDARIAKIKEQNSAILRRKMEVEKDKKFFG